MHNPMLNLLQVDPAGSLVRGDPHRHTEASVGCHGCSQQQAIEGSFLDDAPSIFCRRGHGPSAVTKYFAFYYATWFIITNLCVSHYTSDTPASIDSKYTRKVSTLLATT
jgi:hypothetical protein